MIECYECHRRIPDGEPYVSLDYHIERALGDFVTVDQAEMLLAACIDCAPARVTIKAILRAAGLPIPLDP